MKQGKSSSTAWGVTLARVAHVRFDESPPIFDDSLAFELVEPEIQPMIEHYAPKAPKAPGAPEPAEAAVGTAPTGSPGDSSDNTSDNTSGKASGKASRAVDTLEQIRRARGYLPFRQRYQEECLDRAYRRGVRQFVLLGAGLDAYAFRQPPGREDLRIFEVDFPATQAEKRARLETLGWTLPRNLCFVPCDFERHTLSEALERAGFDPSRPGYFAWMGVTIYLTPETVRATLTEVLALSAKASSIAFEYALPLPDLVGVERASREYSLAQRNREREPFVSAFRQDEIRALVLDVGWGRFEPLDHEAAADRVLAGRRDGVGIHMGFRLAEAFR